MKRPVTAVLLSAGLDSAVLAAAEARSGEVHPIYVSTGLAWERGELAALDRLLATAPFGHNVARLARLSFTVEDLYPASHWALRGEPPAFDTPDEDVYLAGRNVMLLSKAAIYCARHGIGRIALGPLAGNPFPDATPQFFETMARALSLGLAHTLVVEAPFASMNKGDVNGATHSTKRAWRTRHATRRFQHGSGAMVRWCDSAKVRACEGAKCDSGFDVRLEVGLRQRAEIDRLHVGVAEVIALEQQRLAHDHRQRIRKTIAVVERRTMAPFSEPGECAARSLRLLAVDGDEVDARGREKQIQLPQSFRAARLFGHD
ncbi:MAG: queC 2 [Acidobacteria bacterium]|nr:queC 2 [Acidobacteriota bacterium]